MVNKLYWIQNNIRVLMLFIIFRSDDKPLSFIVYVWKQHLIIKVRFSAHYGEMPGVILSRNLWIMVKYTYTPNK